MAGIHARQAIQSLNVLRRTAVLLKSLQSLLGTVSVRGFQYSDFSYRYWLISSKAYFLVLGDLKQVDMALYYRVCSILAVVESFLADFPFEREEVMESLGSIRILTINCRLRVGRSIKLIKPMLPSVEDCQRG
ncbi:hypothetical protein [Stutzerimonas kunmingensis]|jgi:hypothetical protein|uniref:hypothetical protein n=1 Tax=Stutzerimonas kunmingensis TaxID=1211807 RepID=UPI0025672361|nr:hypothetical protein [Stutzerimonas kunmingensis]WOF76888.1 hypothetical protein P5704_012425 [Pseudomonas sp. FeN3W]